MALFYYSYPSGMPYSPDHVRPYALDEWFTSWAYGGFCEANNTVGELYFVDKLYGEEASDAYLPGWLARRQDNPGGDVKPVYAFQWPIKRLPATQCTDGRSNKNTGGMPTMCGDDFAAWLKIILPPPPGTP